MPKSTAKESKEGALLQESGTLGGEEIVGGVVGIDSRGQNRLKNYPKGPADRSYAN